MSVSIYGMIWIFTSQISSQHRHHKATTISGGSNTNQLFSILKEEFTTKTNSTINQRRRGIPSDRRNNVKNQENPSPSLQSAGMARLHNKEGPSMAGFSESASRVHQNDDGRKLFLNYQLQYDRPYNITFGPFTRCTLGVVYNKRGKKPIERTPLRPELRDIIDGDVTADIQTNMKIISVGDSVLMQFHEVLEEAVGAVWADTVRPTGRRRVYHNAWGDHESVSVSAPIDGGGVVAAFRMTGLLLRSGKGRKPPNEGPAPNGAGGWKPEHVQEVLSHKYNTTSSLGDSRATITETVSSFDVMIFRIPHGWLSLDVITKDNLEEALSLAHELFGIRTVIIHSLFFNVSGCGYALEATYERGWMVRV
jgi:hypothetical protein